jgi:hypothetical protein
LVIFIYFFSIFSLHSSSVIFKFFLQQVFSLLVWIQCIFLATTILVSISFCSSLGFSTFFLLQLFYFGSEVSISAHSNYACF